MLHKQAGTGDDALDDQSSHQNGSDHIAGDTERQHRNEGRASYCVVGTLCSANTIDLTFAVSFRMFGSFASFIVSKKAGGAAAHTRHSADERTKNGRAYQRLPVGNVLLEGQTLHF